MQVVQSARDGIDRLDEARRERGLSQMKISDIAGMLDTGSLYCRMYKRGDVSLSKYIKFLRAAGCRLVIMQEEVDR